MRWYCAAPCSQPYPHQYVNVNFTAFRKILKKHDKNLPNPCSAFYIGRLHQQGWVRGDYSDIILNLR